MTSGRGLEGAQVRGPINVTQYYKNIYALPPVPPLPARPHSGTPLAGTERGMAFAYVVVGMGLATDRGGEERDGTRVQRMTVSSKKHGP